MEKIIKINNRDVMFKATASTTRRYREKFHRDILADMQSLTKAYASTEPLKHADLEIFENIAYIMCKQANPNISDSIDDWLDDFDIFSIYEILPQIIKLWNISITPIDESKKK